MESILPPSTSEFRVAVRTKPAPASEVTVDPTVDAAAAAEASVSGNAAETAEATGARLAALKERKAAPEVRSATQACVRPSVLGFYERMRYLASGDAIAVVGTVFAGACTL